MAFFSSEPTRVSLCDLPAEKKPGYEATENIKTCGNAGALRSKLNAERPTVQNIAGILAVWRIPDKGNLKSRVRAA
jgi:hypothetical protein